MAPGLVKNSRIADPAMLSVILSSISTLILSFLIIYGLTASCSVAGITLFMTLLLATPFLIVPAGISAIVARTRPANQFNRLSSLLLALNAVLLTAIFTLLY